MACLNAGVNDPGAKGKLTAGRIPGEGRSYNSYLLLRTAVTVSQC